MTARITLAFVLALIVVAMPVTVARAEVFDPKDYYEVVFELDAGVDPGAYADYVLSQVGADTFTDSRVHHVYRFAINGFSAYLTPEEWAKAERLDFLEVHSLTRSEWGSFTVTPITEVEGQMPTRSIEQGEEVIPTGILRAGAGPEGTDYSTVDVAVIDTGVDRFHPDLNVVGGKDCVAALGDSPDFGFDGYGHGTHVAGTIAARDNGVGVVGVAPGARIWSAKVLDASGSGSFASVLCGIDYVAELGSTIEVANMSLGGGGGPSECGGPDPMHNGICVASERTVFVVAAGNSSADANGQIPAAYDEVVTVSAFADFDGQPGQGGIAPNDRCYAMSSDDFLAPFSNVGEDVDIAAPGVCILSTLPGDLVGVGGYSPNWGVASGTSMASPLVAGCFAKFIAQNPDQPQFARQQILTWSEAHTAPVKGDRDGIHEPLLYCKDVPRYVPDPNEYQGDGA